MSDLLSSPQMMGLLLQALGVAMIAALSFTLLRTIRRVPLKPWTAAWLVLFVALSAMLLAFRVPAWTAWLLPVYMAGEYAFGYLMFVGCREFVTGRPPHRGDLWPVALLGLLALSSLLSHSRSFTGVLAVHTAVYGGLMWLGYRQLRFARPTHRSAPGVRVLRIGFLALATMNLVYATVALLGVAGVFVRSPEVLNYSSFYDLLLLTMLGFGVVMTATGEVQSDLEVARDRLAGLAQKDHLTAAFNRHAFHALLDRDLTGTAAIADVDNLKSINDRYGHSAGDAAIRAVATAIRGCIRADDLLFRWGGDEFLVLILGLPEGDARLRLGQVNERLRAVELPDGQTIGISISMGFAAFDSAESLDEVIRVADTAMYGNKSSAIPSSPRNPLARS
jgi:diguanylate cyclase (GGDEF)-like protein